jgi:hypothetical protein
VTLNLTQCLTPLGVTIQGLTTPLELGIYAYAINDSEGPTPSAPYSYSTTTFLYQP